MCVRTLGSDPAHPHFWYKCQPNEEQIENPQVFFKKIVYEQKDCLQPK